MQDIGQLTYLPECPLCAHAYGLRTLACAIRMCHRHDTSRQATASTTKDPRLALADVRESFALLPTIRLIFESRTERDATAVCL